MHNAFNAFAKSLLKRKLGALTREISGWGSVNSVMEYSVDKRDIYRNVSRVNKIIFRCTAF